MMFKLAYDFQNTDIFEMLGDFLEGLPTLLTLLIGALWSALVKFMTNIYYFLPVILIVLFLIYWKTFKERKEAIRELSRLSADIKTSVLNSIFKKSDKPDALIISPKGRKFAIKFFPNTKKRMNVCIIDGENALISKNNIDVKATDNRAKKISFPIDTISTDYEKIILLSPSAAKLTYVKPNGEVVELRDGEIAFGIRFSTKGTLIRFLEKIQDLG